MFGVWGTLCVRVFGKWFCVFCVCVWGGDAIMEEKEGQGGGGGEVEGEVRVGGEEGRSVCERERKVKMLDLHVAGKASRQGGGGRKGGGREGGREGGRRKQVRGGEGGAWGAAVALVVEWAVPSSNPLTQHLCPTTGHSSSLCPDLPGGVESLMKPNISSLALAPISEGGGGGNSFLITFFSNTQFLATCNCASDL